MPAATVPTILITRPRPFAEELAAACNSEAWHPLILDVITTQGADNPQQIKEELLTALPVKQAIFTSRTSVHHVFQILEARDFAGSGITAVGQGTARELKAVGIDEILLPADEANSEALLRLDQFADRNAGEAIIFCAPGGRRLLQRELRGRGWKVRIAEIYKRVEQPATKATLAQIGDAGRLVTVCTSGTAIRACQQRLPADTWERMINQPWVVISKRLGDLARNAGITGIHQSAAPGNDAIIATIRNII
jgi:uroporphyrinogen-III synthase